MRGAQSQPRETSEVFLVGLEYVGKSEKHGLPLLACHRPPRRTGFEGVLGGANCSVHILLARDRDLVAH